MSCAWFLVACLVSLPAAAATSGALRSIDTGRHTITKVRTAIHDGQTRIIASDFWGHLLAIDYDGTIAWQRELSGLVNHDLWCADLTGDGDDEILAASASGELFCLDPDGDVLWTFRANEVPLLAVCALRTSTRPIVTCGGFDKHLYYLSPRGELLKSLPSRSYSTLKAWGSGLARQPRPDHAINQLRPVRQADGTDLLVVAGTVYANTGGGTFYLFEPLADQPLREFAPGAKGTLGELRPADLDGDGTAELLCGADEVVALDLAGQARFRLPVYHNRAIANIEWFGYRVLHPDLVLDQGKPTLFCLFGARLHTFPPGDVTAASARTLACRYAFNDSWYDATRQTYLLASAQSGGSAVHVLNLTVPGWAAAYEALQPPGKIATILDHTARLRGQLAGFRKPAYQGPSRRLVLAGEVVPESLRPKVEAIAAGPGNPVFLTEKYSPLAEDWDRAGFPSPVYQAKRDRRRTYSQTQAQVLAQMRAQLSGAPGIVYWGGHGNDPMMYSLDTEKKIIDEAAGKEVVIIFPELEDSSEEFKLLLDHFLYPLAEYAKGRNTKLFIRSKHTFWQSAIYEPMWSRFFTGEFADVFVPAMEETTDKAMELSLAARLGIWASGAVDDWGGRCARDNPSYLRLREYSHQMLPNHFLRCLVYWASYGGTYYNNFAVDQEYLSVFWDLVAKGAVFVPRRDQILSFSPVQVAMTRADRRWLDDGNNVKWATFWEPLEDETSPQVFGRLNGTWPGAAVTPWDFSAYAAGVKDRRLNFLPPYPHGLVMITPDQAIESMLHPLYRGLTIRHRTDGRWYYTADGQRLDPRSHAATVAADIRAGAARLPLTVTGDVAWVVAQTDPTHLRLTLIDGGYLDPNDRVANIQFQGVQPTAITDLLDGTVFELRHQTAEIPVPCGLFRFLEIALREPLRAD